MCGGIRVMSRSVRDCPVTGRRLPPGCVVHPVCGRRLRGMGLRLPGMWDDVLAFLGGGRRSDVRPSGGVPGPRFRYGELEDLHLIEEDVEWAAARIARRAEVSVPVGVVSAASVLAAHGAVVVSLPEAVAVYYRVESAVRRLLSTVDLPSARRVVECVHCGHRMYARLVSIRVVCVECGGAFDVDDVQAQMLDQVQYVFMRRRDVLQAVRTLSGLEVTDKTLDKLVAQGRVQPIGPRRRYLYQPRQIIKAIRGDTGGNA